MKKFTLTTASEAQRLHHEAEVLHVEEAGRRRVERVEEALVVLVLRRRALLVAAVRGRVRDGDAVLLPPPLVPDEALLRRGPRRVVLHGGRPAGLDAGLLF